MVFQPQKYLDIIDLSSDITKKQAGGQIVNFITPVINGVIKDVQTNTFDYAQFPFEKSTSSNLTLKSGLYLIINKRTKRIYLGGASNLAQRKGEHKQSFTALDQEKLALAMRSDLEKGQFKDFVFVPLLIIEQKNIKGLQSETFNKEVAQFFDIYVEGPLLNYYLETSPNIFYNVKTTGPFMIGNTFGGSPKSGSPSKPVAYTTTINGQTKTYAWESVSAASKTFDVAAKTIRNKIQKKWFT